MKEGSILVVCPAILRYSWAEELERWFPFCLPSDIHLGIFLRVIYYNATFPFKMGVGWRSVQLRFVLFFSFSFLLEHTLEIDLFLSSLHQQIVVMTYGW